MTTMFILLAGLQALGPDTSAGLARAVTVAAAGDERFDVVSAFDLRQMTDAPQRCEVDGTTAAEACVTRLAAAYEARLIFFLRVYDVSGETHASLTLSDLVGGGVIARHELTGDDKQLFAAIKERTRDALGRFKHHGDAKTRVFVSEPAVQSTALKRQALETRLQTVSDEISGEAMSSTLWYGLAVALVVPVVIGLDAAYFGMDETTGFVLAGAAGASIPVIYWFGAKPADDKGRSLEARRAQLRAELSTLALDGEGG